MERRLREWISWLVYLEKDGKFASARDGLFKLKCEEINFMDPGVKVIMEKVTLIMIDSITESPVGQYFDFCLVQVRSMNE